MCIFIYMDKISFNEPIYKNEYLTEISNLYNNNISYLDKCKIILKKKYNFKNILFTPSCTHALEMMSMILDLKKNDEIIIPSYTFVSSTNAFVKFGINIKLIDSMENNPLMDIEKIEENINSNTKAILLVHYAGFSVDIDKVLSICKKYNLFLLEDAAQAINSYYNGKPLGSFGILSAFSFHYTKNIQCGEGGMLVINDDKFLEKSHIIQDKGTNRHNFINNIVKKYEWVDKGSSYTMAELNAAYLYNQLKEIEEIINHRKKLWYVYKKNLEFIEKKNIGTLIKENKYNDGNYHIFYIILKNEKILNNLQNFLNNNHIQTFTHYISLHESPFYKNNFEDIKLPNCERFSKLLLRLPLHNNLKEKDCNYICSLLLNFINNL